jgi:hypothetical protein
MKPSAATALGSLLAEAPLSLRIAGSCMAPGLAHGSRTALQPAARIWPGDVVAFLTGDGALVAHRVLVALPGRVYTQADRAALPDAAFPRSRLVGRLDVHVSVADRVRSIRRLLHFVARGLIRRLA